MAGGKENKHTLMVGPYKTEIVCHAMGHGSHMTIGTIYPACAPMTDEEAAVHLQALVRGKLHRRVMGQKNAKRRAAKKKMQLG